MENEQRAELRNRAERWFVRRGLPHFIEGYNAREDVLTRAVPFLAVVFLLEVLSGFNEEWSPWANAAAIAGSAAIVLGAVVVVNRSRGRRPFQLPERVGGVELAVFLLVPPLLPLVFGLQWGDALVALGLAVLALIVAFVVTSYGLIPMVRWGAGRLLRQLSDLANLVSRSLPLMLLFSTFLFLNAEMWLMAANFTTLYFWAVMGLIVLVGIAFVVLRIPREVGSLARFDSWEHVIEYTKDLPTEGLRLDRLGGPTHVTALSRREWLNVGLVMLVSQGLQILAVAFVIGAFYVVFGLLAVRADTIEAWILREPAQVAAWGSGENQIVLTWELIRASSFIAAFAGLQFTVAAMTDESYRREFYDDILVDVREAIAVRAVYRARLVGQSIEQAVDSP